jgi:hypothetical protein
LGIVGGLEGSVGSVPQRIEVTTELVKAFDDDSRVGIDQIVL